MIMATRNQIHSAVRKRLAAAFNSPSRGQKNQSSKPSSTTDKTSRHHFRFDLLKTCPDGVTPSLSAGAIPIPYLVRGHKPKRCNPPAWYQADAICPYILARFLAPTQTPLRASLGKCQTSGIGTRMQRHPY